MSFVVPEGFELGFEKTADGRSIWEYVPPGETVESWNQMITVTSKEGGIEGTLQDYFAAFKAGVSKQCPDADVKMAVDKSKAEHPYIGIILDCPLAAGRPHGEMALIQVMPGKSDLYTVQKAWHYKKASNEMQGELKAFIDILLKVRPCNGDTSLPGCG